MDNIETLRQKVQQDPGAPEFADLAQLLAENESARAEAREICLRGLTADPRNAQGRLVLARLYYLDEMPEFAVRELIELRKYSEAPTLERLIASFGDFAKTFEVSSAGTAQKTSEAGEDAGVVAEVDLDVEFSEILEELEKEVR